MFRNLSSEQVQYRSQQVVTKAQIITALIHKHDKQQRINEAMIRDENPFNVLNVFSVSSISHPEV